MEEFMVYAWIRRWCLLSSHRHFGPQDRKKCRPCHFTSFLPSEPRNQCPWLYQDLWPRVGTTYSSRNLLPPSMSMWHRSGWSKIFPSWFQFSWRWRLGYRWWENKQAPHNTKNSLNDDIVNTMVKMEANHIDLNIQSCRRPQRGHHRGFEWF